MNRDTRGPVSCRDDGSFVLATSHGVEFFRPDGTSFGSTKWKDWGWGLPSEEANARSRWSPDGRFLAVWGHVDLPMGRPEGLLGVLDWNKKTLKPITPENSFETAYAWQDKRTLILARHTRDKPDYSLLAVDAETLRQTVLRSRPELVEDLVALADGSMGVAYESGLVELMSATTDHALWSGRHI